MFNKSDRHPKRNKASLLSAAVSPERGSFKHWETSDDLAVTVINGDGNVEDMYTPQCVLRRVHEVMHANNSTPEWARQYDGIMPIIRDIVEDCRIHLRHWPWNRGSTPVQVAQPCVKFIKEELRRAKKWSRSKEPEAYFSEFVTRMRAAAMLAPINGDPRLVGRELHTCGMHEREYWLADQVLDLVMQNRPREAAVLLQTAFFPPEGIIEGNKGDGRGIPVPTTGKAPPSEDVDAGFGAPSMEIIKLPLVEAIPEATAGTAVRTSGTRLYRPALRRPVLPQRMFVRRTPVEPGGTILIDASGSMGDWDEVKKWCAEAPFATVAYYAGWDGGTNGWLWIYAQDGFRAKRIVEPEARGNLVDGPALDWLMKQEGPRVIVTDRQFCGAFDSAAQVVRLRMLEKAGEVEVKRYGKKRR